MIHANSPLNNLCQPQKALNLERPLAPWGSALLS